MAIVSKPLAENAKLFQSPVDRFMSRHCPSVMNKRVTVIVTFICNCHLVRINHACIGIPGKTKIWPLPTRYSSVYPNYITKNDAQTNLISNARTVEIMRVPFAVKWCRLLNFEICAIERNKSTLTISCIQKSGIPVNLAAEY